MQRLNHIKNCWLMAACVILYCIMQPFLSNAQNVSAAGVDFWLGYGAHTAMFNADGTINNSTGGTQEMRLYLSAPNGATVTIEIPLTGWSKTVTLATGTIDDEVVIPKNGAGDARLLTEGILNKGIHISSNIAIYAYCHIYSPGSSATSLLLSEEMLGQDYYTIGTKQAASENNSFAYCFVVATEDATTVEITPSANTLQHSANVPFTVQLKKGQVYNLIGASTGKVNNINTGTDLTGTRIRTLSTGIGPCKKIAVFAGSSGTSVSCSQGGSADNLFQQVLPYRAWGKAYYLAPTLNMGTNMYRVFINTPTKVSVNNVALTNLINGSYYEFTSDKPCIISATNPVAAAQFITSQGQCNNTGNGINGDAEMIYLSPGQPTSQIALYSPAYSNITTHYVNITLRTIAVDSFTIDKVNKKAFFKPFATSPKYSYAQIPVTAGTHLLNIDTLSFSAVAYGYGPDESYGYNGSIFITTLSAISVKNPYSDANQVSPCKTVPFNIEYAIKRRAAELTFDFQQNPDLSPNGIVEIKNPVPDSVYINGPDSFFRYTLPAKYIYANTAGTSFPVNITENIFTAEGCIENRTVLYTIHVDAKPVAHINVNYNTCGDELLNFQNKSVYADGSFISWLWKFGDGTSSNGVENPAKQYNNYGDYTASLRTVTNNGCFADTVKNISLNPLPKADFDISGLYCPLSNIQFSDSSQVKNGWQIASRQWVFGDGTTSAGTNPVKQYNTGGSYAVSLLITTNKNCVDSITKPVTIYTPQPFTEFVTVKNPNATVRSLQACQATPFNLAVTFTARQAEIQWDFNNNVNLIPANNVDINNPVPDSIYYNGQDSFFRYTLPATYTASFAGNLPVKITVFTPTKGGCNIQTIFNHVLSVVEKPVAKWLLVYNNCSNDTLYFKDASLAAGENIQTWQWNFGDATASDSASPVKKYAGFGEYNVHLHIVTALGCYADTTAPVALSPAPVSNFGYASPLYCTGYGIAFTDSSTIQQPFTIAKWLWNFGDETNNSTQNVLKQFNSAGAYTVKLIVYSNHGCTDTLTKTITIYNYPGITMPANVYMPAGSTMQITPAYTVTGPQYLWAPPDFLNNDTTAMPVTAPAANITYLLTVTGNGGCRDTASVTVHVEKMIDVPNAFSPNGDGINDTWRIGNIEGYPACTVKIYNRNGQLIFNSVGYTTPWNGTLDGKPLPMATYYYIINTKSVLFPGKTGSVTIIR